MNKKFLNSTKSAVSIMHDYNNMDKNAFEVLYGVKIYNDGSINDNLYNMSFNNINEWALFSSEQDDEDNFLYDNKNYKSSNIDDSW